MLKLSELARDTAAASITYRGDTVEFTFRPGAYTAEYAAGFAVVDVIAACVTEWNIDVPPTDTEQTKKLPWGMVLAVFRKLSALAVEEDPQGEDDAS